MAHVDPTDPIRGVFVIGTDTEVGKTVVAGAIASTLTRRGERVAVFKPAVTGLDELGGVLSDHELLARSAGSRQSPDSVAPYRFGPPMSPHLAAHLAGTRIDPAHLVMKARQAARNATVLVAEGVGGLMVPLTPHYLVRDLAMDLGMPLVVVARPGLGTINHTLLTVDTARAAGLEVASIVLTPWPDTARRDGALQSHDDRRADPPAGLLAAAPGDHPRRRRAARDRAGQRATRAARRRTRARRQRRLRPQRAGPRPPRSDLRRD